MALLGKLIKQKKHTKKIDYTCVTALIFFLLYLKIPEYKGYTFTNINHAREFSSNKRSNSTRLYFVKKNSTSFIKLFSLSVTNYY